VCCIKHGKAYLKYFTDMFKDDLRMFIPLRTKLNPCYLKTQFVPRSEHLPCPLQKPVAESCTEQNSLFVLRYKHCGQIVAFCTVRTVDTHRNR
jgi:hypothetical protein